MIKSVGTQRNMRNYAEILLIAGIVLFILLNQSCVFGIRCQPMGDKLFSLSIVFLFSSVAWLLIALNAKLFDAAFWGFLFLILIGSVIFFVDIYGILRVREKKIS